MYFELPAVMTWELHCPVFVTASPAKNPGPDLVQILLDVIHLNFTPITSSHDCNELSSRVAPIHLKMTVWGLTSSLLSGGRPSVPAGSTLSKALSQKLSSTLVTSSLVAVTVPCTPTPSRLAAWAESSPSAVGAPAPVGDLQQFLAQFTVGGVMSTRFCGRRSPCTYDVVSSTCSTCLTYVHTYTHTSTRTHTRTRSPVHTH